jgi:hypothetical protein
MEMTKCWKTQNLKGQSAGKQFFWKGRTSIAGKHKISEGTKCWNTYLRKKQNTEKHTNFGKNKMLETHAFEKDTLLEKSTQF